MPDPFELTCSASRSLPSTCSVFLVLAPPLQMKIAAPIPQRKLAGIKLPVVQAGLTNKRGKKVISAGRDRVTHRVNLFRPHIQPHNKIYSFSSRQRQGNAIYASERDPHTWKTELKSMRRQMRRPVLRRSGANISNSQISHSLGPAYLIGKA